MRFRIGILFLAFIVFILLSTLLISYQALSHNEDALSQALMPVITNTSYPAQEIRKQLSLFLVFRKQRITEQTRDMMRLLGIEVLFLGTVSLLLFLGITRPLDRFATFLKDLNGKEPGLLSPFPEQGSAEVRSLILAYNALISRLNTYYQLVGDHSRYRGWKEISRILVHEINNLLSPVQTYAEYLHQKHSREAQARSLLDRIAELRATLHRYRELSHLPEAVLQPHDLSHLTAEVVSEFERASLETAELPPVMLDPILYREILRNLLKNAHESGPGVLTTLRLIRGPQEIRVEISDNGPGIPDTARQKVFEPGWTSKPQHSGIGLSLVRSLAAELQARLELQSSGPQGTVFQVIFNCREAD